VRRNERLARARRTGWWVFAALIVLVVLEYVVFLALERNLPLMVVMNITDAGLILWYFMHVGRLWRRAEEEEA
jgi:cytochrome c oxidase subunit IV